jgi:hypothetical protein
MVKDGVTNALMLAKAEGHQAIVQMILDKDLSLKGSTGLSHILSTKIRASFSKKMK